MLWRRPTCHGASFTLNTSIYCGLAIGPTDKRYPRMESFISGQLRHAHGFDHIGQTVLIPMKVEKS